MSYTNIVFVKLEKRLLNDYRWYTMSDQAQLVYIKFMLLAAETYNKIPKKTDILTQALRVKLEPSMIKKCIEEIKENFPKFKENKHFFYFEDFETKTNYIPKKGNPEEIPGKSKDSLDKEEEIEKEKRGQSHAFIPPSLQDIKNYISQKKYCVDGEQFFNFFTESGWVDSRGNKVKNWKQKIITWNAHQPKQKTEQVAEGFHKP